MYGLKQKHIDAITSVFQLHAFIEQAVLYGSRAKGNFSNGSDIDLSLKGEGITLTRLLKIETKLDDLLLPYKIDLSIFGKIESKELIAHIERVGIVFYEKKKERMMSRINKED